MKAVMWYGKNDVRVVNDAPEPKVTDDLVKIQVKWCGICGSDLHEYLAGPLSIQADTPHPLTGEKAPIILGHEFSGVVLETGRNVTHVKAGDRVVVEPLIVCGECPACMAGKYNLCQSLAFYGFQGGGGAFSEITTIAGRFVYKMPDSMSFEKGALVEPVTVGLHSLVVGGFTIGQTAVVAGAGAIGLGTIECLRAGGARQIIVVQRKSVRQKYAKAAGADVVLDPNEVDVVAEVKRLTNGLGADIAFEDSSAEQCYNLLLKSLRFAGTLVVPSLWENGVHYDPNDILKTEKKIVGSICYAGDFPSTIALMADGRIKADGLITKKIYIDDILEEGFGTLTGPDKKAHVKILVTPDKSLL